VGPLVDRYRRRRLLLGADLGRAVLMAWIPIAPRPPPWPTGTGRRRIRRRALSLLFNVAYQAYLPNVVPADRLCRRQTPSSALASRSAK